MMHYGPTRHEQRKVATHQRLLEAAREVIVELGYNNVDILDITERANVSKATFYKHFPNKEECVRQLMHQGFDALVEQIMDSERIVPERPDWVINSFEQVFVWAQANREILLIMVGGAASTQLNQFGRQYMVEIIQRTMPPPVSHNTIPPAVKAQIATGMIIQLLGWWLENDTGYLPRDMAQMIYTVLTSGLGLPAE